MASLTRAMWSGPTVSKSIRTVPPSRCTPSAITSSTAAPRPAAAIAAPTGPGERDSSGGMPLKRWVASGSPPRTPRAATASRARVAVVVVGVGVAQRPQGADCRQGGGHRLAAGPLGRPGHLGEGARRRPPRRGPRRAARSASTSAAGFWAPHRTVDRNGPSRCMPASSPLRTRSPSVRAPVEQGAGRGGHEGAHDRRRPVLVVVSRGPVGARRRRVRTRRRCRRGSGCRRARAAGSGPACQPSGSATSTQSAGSEARSPAYVMVRSVTATAPSATTRSGRTTAPVSRVREVRGLAEVT